MVFSSQPRHVFGEGITNLRYRTSLLFQTFTKKCSSNKVKSIDISSNLLINISIDTDILNINYL